MTCTRCVAVLALAGALAAVTPLHAARAHERASPFGLDRVDVVDDGDTIETWNGYRVRLVQIDTPEVQSYYRNAECYGERAGAVTERLLPSGTPIRLVPDPATDRVDTYGRVLAYVIRVRDGLNVNVRLVAVGAAAPYFYDGRRGRYARLLERLALRARRLRLGLWGRCPSTPYDPRRGVATGPAN
jgi:endonuclease YncB( thermonuclease family)